MRVEILNQELLNNFLRYCKEYGDEHDQSYLLSIDMQGQDFTDKLKNPTVVLMDNEEILGTVSLMTYMNFSEEKKKYRLRIMHSTIKSFDSYKMLWQALMDMGIDFDQLFLFIPKNEKTNHMDNILKRLGFSIERISYVLMNREESRKIVEFPDGYTIRPLDTSTELDTFANVRNICFKHLMGARNKVGTDFLPYIESREYIEGSMMLLEFKGEVVGFLAVGPDEDDKACEAGIGGIGLLPEHRGKGIGKALLRYGVNFLKDKGFTDIWLSVNGENEDAVRLYIKEGFVMEEEVVCYVISN